MTKYIVKPRHSICTAKGIIGPPVNPENPTAKEIVTVEHFKNGQRGLTALLQHKKCPLVIFEPEKKAGEDITEKNLQQPGKENEKSKGAVKK